IFTGSHWAASVAAAAPIVTPAVAMNRRRVIACPRMRPPPIVYLPGHHSARIRPVRLAEAHASSLPAGPANVHPRNSFEPCLGLSRDSVRKAQKTFDGKTMLPALPTG